MPTLSPFALALLGQLPQGNGQEPDQDEDDQFDFGKAALAQQQQEDVVSKRKRAATAREDDLWKSLVDNAVDSRPVLAAEQAASLKSQRDAALADAAAQDLKDQTAAEIRNSLASRLATVGPRTMASMTDDRRDRSNLASGNFAMTMRPDNAPEGRYAAPIPSPPYQQPRRMTRQEMQDAAEDNRFNPLPSGHPLREQLAGMTLDNSDVTDGFADREKARAEAKLQREFRAADNEAERFASARRKSQTTARRGTDLRGAGVPDAAIDSAEGRAAYLADMAPRRPLGNTEAEIRRNMALTAKRPLGDALRGSAGNDQVALADEFAERKARMADPDRELGEYGKMAQANAKPPSWTPEQVQAIKTAKDRVEKSSARNLAAMIAGRGGQSLSAKDLQDPRVLKAYATGQRQGPTLAQAMAFQRDREEERRAAAYREQILREVEGYRRLLDNEPDVNKRATIQAKIDNLLPMLQAAPRNVAVLPEIPPAAPLRRQLPTVPPATPSDPRRPSAGGAVTTPGQAWMGQGGLMPWR